MTRTCDGTCCQAFVLGGYSKEEIQGFHDDAIRVWMGEFWGWEPRTCKNLIEGIETWWQWMVFIGHHDSHPVTREKSTRNGMDYFTCNQRGPGGLCLVYENRPHFCRSYGVTIACEHEGCTWKGVLTKEEVERRKEQRAREVRKYLKVRREMVCKPC